MSEGYLNPGPTSRGGSHIQYLVIFLRNVIFLGFFSNSICMPPMIKKSYRDITSNIPNKFLASGAPMARPRIIFSDFSSFYDSSQELTDIYPG